VNKGIDFMLRYKSLAAVLILAALTGNAPAENISGAVWRNPANSVHIRAQPCGDKMCGVVVWANDKAKADARKGSRAPLVGAQLFHDFVREKKGTWRGSVFVPDIGRTFSGRITMLDSNRLEAKGCLVGRVGCRSQIWTRIES
jgi:uncharacterized protein (DUF2147 family)